MSLPTNPVRGQQSHEHVIMAALQSGDMRRAVELLLQAYQDQVYAYCARLVGQAEALCVYQRVLAAAIDDLPTRSHTTTLRGWLFGIARKMVTHEHRSGAQAQATALDPDYVPVAGTGELPGERLREYDDDLIEAMAQLDPRTQEVLQFAMWHGLSVTEIARVTEQPVALVREMAGEGLMVLSSRGGGRQEVPS